MSRVMPARILVTGALLMAGLAAHSQRFLRPVATAPPHFGGMTDAHWMQDDFRRLTFHGNWL